MGCNEIVEVAAILKSQNRFGGFSYGNIGDERLTKDIRKWRK